MCFGIRILSPFHLNTLKIPIQNMKCPKNTKNACADIIFSPAIICEAWTFVFAQACQTQSVWPAMLSMNHIVRCNALCRDMWSKMKVIAEFCYFSSKHLKRDSGPKVEAHMTAMLCPRMRFWCFRHLIFWIGMFKVFRWNRLEILIPKHMWKSIIGPLEQI